MRAVSIFSAIPRQKVNKLISQKVYCFPAAQRKDHGCFLEVGGISTSWVQRGLGIWCWHRKLCLPDTMKLISERMGWRLGPQRILWIWGIKQNGFHVGLSFLSALCREVHSLESWSDPFHGWILGTKLSSSYWMQHMHKQVAAPEPKRLYVNQWCWCFSAGNLSHSAENL